MKSNTRKLKIEKRRIAETVIVITLLVLIFYFIEQKFTMHELRAYIDSFGPWKSVVLFFSIVITSSTGLVSPVPVILASLLLGPYASFIVSMLGLTAGAAISFLIARFIGRDYVEKQFIDKIKALKRYDDRLENRGFWTILFLRIIYLVPYELINIVAGLSKIKFTKFLVATIIGIIPTVFFTVLLVRNTADFYSFKFISAALCMTLFAILPLMSKRIRQIVFNLDD
jgi:uncharacterized membrane protein YdjX (TVP38/TMEM64 family)